MSKIRPYKYPQDKTEIKALLLETVVPIDDLNCHYSIIAYSNKSVLIGIHSYTFKELFEKFIFSDGSPCGIEEDEK